MSEMKITITAADLAEAINNLAVALANSNNTKPTEQTMAAVAQPATPTVPVNPTPAPTVPAQAPGASLSATPAQTAASVAPTVPAVQPVPTGAPTANAAPAVPTSAPQYTLEMIATAGSSLIDVGKMDQLMQLLGKFGVASLTELAPENYGAVAGELRALGATI